jgi:valyl-tRNA synthetase
VNHPDLKEQLNSSLAMSVRPDLKVFLPVSAIPDRGGLSKRFRRKLDGVERELSRLVTRMERPEYATRTPAHVQEKDRQVATDDIESTCD